MTINKNSKKIFTLRDGTLVKTIKVDEGTFISFGDEWEELFTFCADEDELKALKEMTINKDSKKTFTLRDGTLVKTIKVDEGTFISFGDEGEELFTFCADEDELKALKEIL